MSDSDLWVALVIAGLAGVSVLTRNFFLISERSWKLPRWVQRGLQYAPIAALAAITAPDLVMDQGHFNLGWTDARLWSALAAIGYYAWRAGDGLALPLSIIVGLTVFLPLRIGLGL